uniref:Reverse transcriptase domain-containing protein n=1 Tax=Cannabis sativa TaxID=3483 RepID=A0A803Q947_CANSA
MEAEADHQDFFIMGATPAIARVMIMDLSRGISRGYWFYLYKVRSRFPVCVSEHVDGLFMVTFGCEGDKGRVLEGQPWHFAQSITVFAAPDTSFPITPDTLHYVPFWVQVYGIPFMCKSYELARFIASEVGDLIEVDKDTVREGTGPYLTLRILLDVNLPICRGMNIRFIRMGREFIKWLDFKYERLPDFCFYCGRLDHTKRYYHAFLQKCDDTLSKPPCPYKGIPFQYPHPPAMTLLDVPPVNLNISASGSLGSTIPFLNFNTTSALSFTHPQQSTEIMIPTPVNPNLHEMIPPFHRSGLGLSLSNSAFTPYSTDSVIVTATVPLVSSEPLVEGSVSQNPISVSHDGSCTLNSHSMEMEFGLNMNQPDFSVRDCIITISDNETFRFTGFYGSPDASKRNKYTWTNNTIFERLDWAIVLDSWCNLFPSAALHHLPYYGSDHRALKVMVTQNVPNHHPHSIKRFHFENVWLENPDFYTTLNNAWGSNSHNVSTVGAYSRFLHSQKAFITSLTSWGRSVGNSFKPRMAYLQKEIERLQSIHPRDSDTLSHIKHIQSQLDALLYREERKCNNTISLLRDDNGNIANSVEDMSNFVLSYFEDLFHCDGCDTEAVNHILDCLGPPLEDLEIDFLNQPFTFDEVQKAVFQLSGDKAPGLDGLNAYFYQRKLGHCRVIFDNILIAQEVVHAINTRKHGKSGWAALKLDMAKAFDRVNWHYLESVMLHFNFPVSFVSLIMKCVTTSSLSFLVNGSVTCSIKPSRGIRQGDPLSPYLFLLCAEGLSSLLCAHQSSGSLKGISISRRAPSISHLLFADDSLIFCSADRDSCSSLRNIFLLYSIASGQVINFAKSSILFSPNTPQDIRSLFFATFDLEDRPFISKYLGLPQCLARSKYHSFAFLKDRVLSVLTNWSGKWFSKAGKEILLKAVIQAIPAYAMACFRLPVKLCKGIEAAMARFWWGSSGNNNKIHWKSWKKLCQSKSVGGLGFRSLIHFNQAMLAKQAWKILKQPNSLLCRVLKARYFPNPSILEVVPGHNPSFAWRSILWGRDLMASGLIWKIGDGENILTIDDHWIPNNKYLCYKDGILPPSPKLSFFISDSGYWDSSKLRNHFYESDIQDILEVPITGFSGKDDIIWSRESSRLFTIKFAYHLALSTQDIRSSSSDVTSRKFWNKIWHSQAPPKIKHFMWRVVSHTIPVASNLFVRHILDSPLCSFCKSSPEMVHHALLGCSRLRKAWKSSRFVDHYHKYKHLDITDFLLSSFEALDKDYIIILFYFLWALWNQRNNYIHHHTVMPAADIFDWSVNYFFQYIDAQKNIQNCSVAARAPNMVSDGVSGSSLKVYTDAAIDIRGQRYSFGIVVVDNSGLMKAGVVKPCIGGIPAIIAEAKAIYHALQWVQLLHLPVDVLKTDCKTIVDKLNSCNWNANPLDDILMGIKNLLSFSPNLRIEHVYRDSNQLAHWAAKLGLGLDNEFVWNGSLPSL